MRRSCGPSTQRSRCGPRDRRCCAVFRWVDQMSTETPARDDRAFFGHPRGLGYLVFAESWERFSFYGMLALLALYLSKQLLLPGHVENVAGFGPFRAVLQASFGAYTPLAVASAIAGLYGAMVYLTPLIGGLIA